MASPLRLLPLALLLGACTPEEEGPQDDTSPGADDTSTTGEDMPPDPTPFTVTVNGAANLDLVFDSPTCYQPVGSTNLRVFWRNGSGAHVFVLMAEVLGDFTGPGTYGSADTQTRAKLQEEAGGEGRYFEADPGQGDSVTVTVDHVDENRAWGEFTAAGMHGDTGAIALSPMPVPIWCPELN